MVSKKDAEALNQPGASGPAVDETPAAPVDASAPVEYEVEGGGDVFLSEGMRHDLLVTGSAVDPNTGRKVTRK